MDCLFCKIIAGEVPSTKVLETDDVLVIEDIHPQAPIHVLIMPKKHIVHVGEAAEDDLELLGNLLLTAKKVADQLQIKDYGFKLISNNGKSAGQEIDHLHIHLQSRMKC